MALPTMAGRELVGADSQLACEANNVTMKQAQDIPNQSANTSLALIRGSSPRSLARIESRKLIQRKGHDLVIATTPGQLTRRDRQENPERFSWLGDLRRGKRHVWGGILTFVDFLISKGNPEKVVQILPDILREYISDGYRGRAA